MKLNTQRLLLLKFDVEEAIGTKLVPDTPMGPHTHFGRAVLGFLKEKSCFLVDNSLGQLTIKTRISWLSWFLPNYFLEMKTLRNAFLRLFADAELNHTKLKDTKFFIFKCLSVVTASEPQPRPQTNWNRIRGFSNMQNNRQPSKINEKKFLSEKKNFFENKISSIRSGQ